MVFALTPMSGGQALAQPTEAAAEAVGTARALFTKYCTACHNDRLKTAGLTLDLERLDRVAADAELWEKVILRLRTASMPPAGRPRPDPDTYNTLASWLEGEIDRAAAATPSPGRMPALHRLNRAEYQNAIRDLLSVEEVDVGLLLPADDSSYGFDNIADALWISPTHLARYIAAARKIARQAVGDPTAPVSSETYHVPPELAQDDRFMELPIGTRGGLLLRRDVPVDGEYRLTVTLAGRQRTPDTHQLEITVDGERLQLLAIGGPASQARSAAASPPIEVRVPLRGGRRAIGVSFVRKTSAESEELVQPFLRPENGVLSPQPAIGSLTMTGPFGASRAASTPSRQRIFVCQPGKSTADEGRCARAIVSALARRAYRRPVTDLDIEPLLSFFSAGRAEADFDRGIQRAIERLLVSPAFLFRIERDPDQEVGRISALELASRLSFFLWSSIPDDELLDLAIRGTLSEPAVLESQIRRMLADSRAHALVANFAGQWLHLRNVAGLAPDRLLFPDFDEGLRQAMRSETELLFDSVMRENRSVLELLSADYTFVNERLARHYGIRNVYGSHFRRVPVTDPHRRGLLGHGSILTLTSYATRTSPVLRGKWILDNLIGGPPPPPPPDIPALVTERGGTGEKLSMRAAMEQHRANPACASCHSRMDPLGFALENFDALGRWRVVGEDKQSIDAAGVLPGGIGFDGAAGLREVLLGQPEQLVRTLTEKLLVYALGRGLEHVDAPAVRRIVHQSRRQNFTFVSLVQGIVTSPPFQLRMRSS